MGFWQKFFADTSCGNCGSYNLEKMDVERAGDILERYTGYEGSIDRAYKCKDCGEITFYDWNNKKIWTVRKH